MNNEENGQKPLSIEEQNREHNQTHNELIEYLLNKDFEKTHGYPHPRIVQEREAQKKRAMKFLAFIKALKIY